MTNVTAVGISLATGVVTGAVLATLFLSPEASLPGDKIAAPAAEPLYWVAPMDPDYRRDGPGKSPMGMDLVPVYAREGSAGLVTIAPDMVNNLGVKTDTVSTRTLHEEIRSVGYVGYDEDKLVHIHPRVEGWVEQLFVTAAGNPVEKGQPLYALYSPQLVNAQEEMLLALRRGDKQLVAAAEMRLRALQISPDFIAQLRSGGGVQQTVIFHAGEAGVIDNLNIREGFFVGPDTTMMSIASMDQIWVEVEVFERQSALVSVGQSVEMTLDYLPGRRWRGQVDYVYPSLDPVMRTLRIRLRFDNQDGLLKPNMFAQVAIQSPPLTMLAVPTSAVILVGREARVVLAESSGTFRSVPVRLGRTVGEYREVLQGLQEGARVVTSAQFLLDSESSRSAAFDQMEPASDRDEKHDHGRADTHEGHDQTPALTPPEPAGHKGVHHD
jgi:Cu(I)/Ag(I) efflux system membrane fusion protein